MNVLTPMMKQYTEIKKEYPNCILFFRLGDFYEMFAEDAITASKDLEIVLTARDGGMGTKIPMCGVPYHALDNYLAKLILKGHKVAICEQMEDPKLAKGIVERSVIRVVTPGTVMEGQMLSENKNNFLMAIWREKFLYGIAYTDISTGDFFATEINVSCSFDELADEIMRIAPVECILPKDLYNDQLFSLRFKNKGIKCLNQAINEKYILQNAGALLKAHYKIASLEALGLNGKPCAINACALILDFLMQTQKKNLEHLKTVSVYSTDQFMHIDANTQRNLELVQTQRTTEKTGSLLWVLDYTQTALGARLLKDWLLKPLIDTAAIYFRQDGVEELVKKAYLGTELSKNLNKIYDLERLISRIASGNTNERDLLSLKLSLSNLPKLFKTLANLEAPIFRMFVDQFDTMEDMTKLIEESIEDDKEKNDCIIKRGYNAAVDELRDITLNAKGFLRQIEITEKAKTGIKSLKISYNKVFGYYIEVTNNNLDLIPPEYIRKQTLVNAERFITPELKEWEDKILTASERLNVMETALFDEVREKIAANRSRIQNMAIILANLDVLQSFARAALENDFVRPLINDGDIIEIKDGRHPVIEKIIGHEHFIPNDCYLDNDTEQLRLITGPNMCGKSTYMRQVALIVLLAKIGSFVPASYAKIGAVDRIFTRVGASDDLASGQSTFMVEMCETANILRNATNQSLVILDEIGRGTSTFDGLSIAWSVAETLIQPELRAKTLFATHYHELTELENLYMQIKNYSVAVKDKDGEIVFLRKIVKGGTDKSYGIHVAALAGLPTATLKRAGEILSHMEEEKNIDFSIEAVNSEEFSAKTIICDPILQEIQNIDINSLSPLDALMKLAQWQQKIKA